MIKRLGTGGSHTKVLGKYYSKEKGIENTIRSAEKIDQGVSVKEGYQKTERGK